MSESQEWFLADDDFSPGDYATIYYDPETGRTHARARVGGDSGGEAICVQPIKAHNFGPFVLVRPDP